MTFPFLDGVVDFLGALEGWDFLYYFWPFFLIDFARYVILDSVVLFWYLPRRWGNRSERATARRRLFRERPLVSVVVPGKNEGPNLPALVRSLERQTYMNYELVVVDDGSDDATPAICRRLQREGKIDRYVRNHIRGGKASAANTALLYARGRFVVHLDADSHLRHDALERLVLPFYLDPEVGAVGGDIRAANADTSFATRVQAMEYMKAISIGRTVTGTLGVLRIVSGACGAFRRSTLDRIGGWDVGPGLDGDLTMKIRKLGLKVVHEPLAACYTNVPTTFRRLARQRYRWDRSMIRFRIRKHGDVFRFWSNFRWTNLLSSVENVFFSAVLNVKWWIYLMQMLIFHPGSLPYLLFINYVLYVITNSVQFSIAWLTLRGSLDRDERKLFLYVPIMPPYIGIFLRLVRTYAHLMEIFSRASYRDPWNPWKVSRVAQQEGL